MPRSGSKNHPRFDETDPSLQWTGSLAELYPVLRGDAARAEGRWTYRVLPRGVQVAMRRRGDLNFRLEVRIARAEPLEDEGAAALWEKELAVFWKHWGLQITDGTLNAEHFTNDWLRTAPHPDDAGKTAVRILQLRPGECKPGIAICGHCGDECTWWVNGGHRFQRCDKAVCMNDGRAKGAPLRDAVPA